MTRPTGSRAKVKTSVPLGSVSWVVTHTWSGNCRWKSSWIAIDAAFGVFKYARASADGLYSTGRRLR